MVKKKNKIQDSEGNKPSVKKEGPSQQGPSSQTVPSTELGQLSMNNQQQQGGRGRGQQQQQGGRGRGQQGGQTQQQHTQSEQSSAQSAWGQPKEGGGGQQQQRPQSSEQPTKSAWGQPKQGGRGQQQQQRPQSSEQPSAQSQSASGQPKQGGRGKQQQRPQSSEQGQQQQQRPQSSEQPKAQSSWGQQKQGGGGQQQQQQPSAQPQSAWGQPQQAGRGQQQQQPSAQPQSAWGQPQQAGRGQQPQQAGRGQSQQPGRGFEAQQRGPSQTGSREQTPKDTGAKEEQKTYTKRPEYIPTKDSYAVARRNEKGTKGEKIRIEVNYLKLLIERLAKIVYHYDITFDPDKPKKNLPYVFEKFRQTHFPQNHLAYDGMKNVYSSKRLNMSQVLESEVVLRDDVTLKDRTYKVTMKEVNNSEIDMTALMRCNDTIKPIRAINCLDIILRMAFQCKAVAVGRSFFRAPTRRVDLGDGYELWTGLFQSAILGARPYLNVDVAHKGFPSEMSIIDLIKSFRFGNDTSREMDSRSQDELASKLKGLNLIYSVDSTAPRLYKFNGLKNTPSRQTFKLEDGTTLTIQEYFRKKQINLRYPHLPCLHVGNTMKNTYVPMEFCKIQKGQAIMKKLNENQTRNMIRESATSTDVRKQKIMDILKAISHNNNPVIKEFGINIGGQFEEIDARILAPPTLEYKNNQKVVPRDGVWRAEGKYFLNGQTVTNWSILVLDDRIPMNVVHRFAGMIQDHGKSLSMSIADNYDVDMMKPFFKDFEIDKLMNKLKDYKIELLFVVIPDRPDCYHKVKQAAELRCGILTQCIKSGTLQRRLDASTVCNVLLKVNAKLNGSNHKVAQDCCPNVIKGKVMLIGADVTHPAGDQYDPSCVGVAASHDETSFKYNICWRLQDPKKEIIVDLKNIVIDQLQYYKKCRNYLPDKIIYYRDGVSDGQFQEVLDVELKAVYAACQQFGQAYKPGVTFIIVQKRHHTRFFPTKNGKRIGKNNNVCPGTIVDSEITAPNELQFFLVSHASIQGVAKPTKYCLLWDDSNIPIDDLQALTYNLCHLFTRCNRTVSYVAPTYYAHLVASRARVYVTGDRINLDRLDQEFKKRSIREEIVHGHPMFFV